MSNRIRTAVTGLVLLGASLAQADAGIGLALTGGTTGYGLELSYAVQPGRWGVRVPLTADSEDGDADSEGVRYNVHMDTRFYGVLGDWHPFGGVFRVTGGLYYNGTDVSGDSLPTVPVWIGATQYSPAQVGLLSVKTRFSDSIAPYFGVGWGNSARREAGFYYSFDVGVMYTGSLDVTVASTGTVATTDLLLEARDLEDNVQNTWWPVGRGAVGWRF